MCVCVCKFIIISIIILSNGNVFYVLVLVNYNNPGLNVYMFGIQN